MGKREKKIAVIQEYLPRCNSVYPCYVYGRIPSELINNACMTYAGNVRKENVFGLIDETVFRVVKKGFCSLKMVSTIAMIILSADMMKESTIVLFPRPTIWRHSTSC